MISGAPVETGNLGELLDAAEPAPAHRLHDGRVTVVVPVVYQLWCAARVLAVEGDDRAAVVKASSVKRSRSEPVSDVQSALWCGQQQLHYRSLGIWHQHRCQGLGYSVSRAGFERCFILKHISCSIIAEKDFFFIIDVCFALLNRIAQ